MLAHENDTINRSQMSAEERRLRSRLVQLLSQRGLLRGTLSVRYRTCGKSGCKCARGEKHRGVYLVFREAGRFRQVFIPRRLEARVRLWVQQYQEVRELLESLSALLLTQVKGKDGRDSA